MTRREMAHPWEADLQYRKPERLVVFGGYLIATLVVLGFVFLLALPGN